MSKLSISKATSSRKANGKPRKLFLFVEVVENHGGVYIIENTMLVSLDIQNIRLDQKQRRNARLTESV